jgi:hypothetical protein
MEVYGLGTFQTVGKQKPGGPQRNTLRRTQLTVRQICHLPKRFRAHVEKGEYVLEVDGKPLVPLGRLKSSPKGEKRFSLFLSRAGNRIARSETQRLNKL